MLNHFKSFYVTCLIVLLWTLTACAFHLRGQGNWPPALQTIYLQAQEPYDALTINLTNSLHSSGVTLVDSPNQARVTLKLYKPVLSTRNVTIGRSNQSRVYQVVYSVAYMLTDPAGKPFLPQQVISSTRSLTLSPNQLMDSNNQLILLEQEMQRDIINQLYNRLTSKQVFQALI